MNLLFSAKSLFAPPVSFRGRIGAEPLPPECFSRRFCDDHGCSPDRFLPMVMRLCLNQQARLLHRLRPNAEIFAADRELVQTVARAVAMDEVRAAVDDFWTHPANETWLRRTVALRLSTRRLRQMAHGYLPFARPRSTPRIPRFPL